MVRGTNAEFRWKLPYDVSELGIVKITFWQENNSGPSTRRPLPIVKSKDQCYVGYAPNIICVTLNQEETLRFSDNRKAKVQLRAMTLAGTPFASPEHLIAVYPVYDDSVLDDTFQPTPDVDALILLDGQAII